MAITQSLVTNKLKEVLDPELGISIVDLGLIYKVTVNKNEIDILMTLTTPGCPLISVIEEDIRLKISELGIEKNKIKINLTFEPAWTMDKVTKKGRKLLGF